MARGARLVVAMYVVEGFACFAWIYSCVTGATPSKLLAAVGLTVAAALLHLGAVLADIEERIERIRRALASR